jgi:polysaccharide biosynthesis/export protein
MRSGVFKYLSATARFVIAMVGLMTTTLYASAQDQRKPPQQQPTTTQTPKETTPNPGAPSTPPVVPADYVIGPDDVLSILFWRNQEISGDVVVRPDGLISLPVLNEVHAAGLTPEQLRQKLMQQATKYFEEPNVTIVVKAINSRKVYITGMVAKPGPYSLSGAMTVVQLIAMAGGLHEFADAKNISVLRTENGRQVRIPFNYKDVQQGRNLKQNILLKPGDTVIVP